MWSMPVFETSHSSISLSACKNHVSLYVGSETILKFQAELNGFVTKKNAVYLPYTKEFPSEIIKFIISDSLSPADFNTIC